MDPLNANPFSLLTFIAAPAILTNASSVNVLSTSNRLARSMERARAISIQIEEHEDDSDNGNAVRLKLLKFAERRTLIIVRALTCFYIAIGSFAAASLISLLGAVFVAAQQDLLRQITLAVSLCAGIVGVGGLTIGSGLLVFETRMALRGMAEETRFLLSKHKHKPSA
jgi:Protein of unknown function (DUF2721)